MRKKSWLLATVCTIYLQLLSNAYGSTTFNEALDCFKQKRFHAAADLLQQVIHKEPYNSQAYFYLGSALEQLKDRDGAKAAYEACFQLDPFSSQAAQVKQNILKLINEQAALDHPHDSPQIVTKTVNTINQQANALAQNKMDYADNNAAYRLNLANIEMQKIMHDRNMQLINLRYGGNYNNGYNRRINYDPWGEEDISNLAIINTYYQQTDGLAQSNLYRTAGLKAARYAQDSANELVSELSQEHIKKDEPNLRALGTNLFVRNYSSYSHDDIAPQDPLVQLKATQGKLPNQTMHPEHSKG